VFVLRRLKRNAIHRARYGAKIACDAAFSTIGITREDDAASPARRQVRFLFRILDRLFFVPEMQKDVPDAS
jgi:hypothetical protein